MLIFRNVYLSQGEYIRLSLRYTLRAKLSLLPLLLIPLLGIIAWLAVLLSPRPSGEVVAAYSTTLLLVTLFAVLIPFSLWQGMKRNYLSSKILQAPATYSFDGAGIKTDSPFAQATIPWVNASALYRLPPYAILMVNTVSGYFLDFRCLEAPGTEADFLALLREQRVKIN